MKKINLLKIDNLFVSKPTVLEEEYIKEYLNLDKIKDKELITLNALCNTIRQNVVTYHVFDNFYLNYEIPQIGKEFDLLRIGVKSVVNIELKSQKVDEEDIQKQLERNYYYLSFLQKEIYCYSFVMDGDTNRLYYYNNEKNSIEELHSISDLISDINDLVDIKEDNIDNLFDPSNYLISPFNTTDQFINDEYFLTKHQEQIRDEIIKKIQSNSTDKIFSISGAAGTGKTLLTYDIAKALRNIGKRVTIIHCAQTNNGIYKLQSVYKWNIITIRNYIVNTLPSDVLIFDESQRISKAALDNIIGNESKFILFSHDINQKLNRTNQASLVVKHIESIANKNNHKLKSKIRHNKNLASFIKKFYDLTQIKSDPLSRKDYDNISFYYTKEISDASSYIEHLKSQGWEHIYLSNSLHTADPLDNLVFTSFKSSHKVIGQEYENVVVTISKDFYYTEDKKLSYNANYYYNPLETLFQAITRTRKNLTFVIIDNENVYKKCIQIVNRC